MSLCVNQSKMKDVQGNIACIISLIFKLLPWFFSLDLYKNPNEIVHSKNNYKVFLNFLVIVYYIKVNKFKFLFTISVNYYYCEEVSFFKPIFN